jgi:hypothetical protein
MFPEQGISSLYSLDKAQYTKELHENTALVDYVFNRKANVYCNIANYLIDFILLTA